MSKIEFSAEEKETIEEAMRCLICEWTPFPSDESDKPYLTYLDNLHSKIEQWINEDNSIE